MVSKGAGRNVLWPGEEIIWESGNVRSRHFALKVGKRKEEVNDGASVFSCHKRGECLA